MAALDLQFIGTGNAFVPTGTCWNGFLADGRHLFEAPPTALMAIRKLAIDPNSIDTVVISHHHGDHFLGLPMLLLHWKYFERKKPATIAGPPGTAEHAQDICERVYPGVFDGGVPVEWVELQPGAGLKVGSLELEAVEVQHDRRLLCLGFAARISGRRLAYTGDSGWCDAVRDLARNADAMIAECTSRSTPSLHHMNLVDDIPRVRAALPAEAPLFLTHTSGDIQETGLPGTIVAEDYRHYLV